LAEVFAAGGVSRQREEFSSINKLRLFKAQHRGSGYT
jgi:hypothetical protein